MIHNPHDKVTLTQLTDQAFRSKKPHRAVNQLVHILDVQGIPRFFTPIDRVLLKGFQSFGSYLPGVAVSQVKKQMQEETANVILPAERELLTEHLRNRRQERVRMNVNFLGEALLGEEEAQNRLKRYLTALQLPEIEVISVKISTIYSQISALGRDHTLATLCDRLEMLYRASAKSAFERADGTTVNKFVYLDMEEYRDLDLTTEAFTRTLDRAGARARRGRHRLAELHSRLVPLPDASAGLGQGARGGGRSAHDDADREGCQHGNGALRGVAAWLAPSALQNQDRNRCQFSSDGSPRAATRKRQGRTSRDRLPQPLRTGLRSGRGA